MLKELGVFNSVIYKDDLNMSLVSMWSLYRHVHVVSFLKGGGGLIQKMLTSKKQNKTKKPNSPNRENPNLKKSGWRATPPIPSPGPDAYKMYLQNMNIWITKD